MRTEPVLKSAALAKPVDVVRLVTKRKDQSEHCWRLGYPDRVGLLEHRKPQHDNWGFLFFAKFV